MSPGVAKKLLAQLVGTGDLMRELQARRCDDIMTSCVSWRQKTGRFKRTGFYCLRATVTVVVEAMEVTALVTWNWYHVVR